MLYLILTFIPLVILALHFVAGDSTKGRLKSALLDQYVRLDAVTDRTALATALVALRWQMEKARKWFITMFGVLSLAALVTTLPAHLETPRKELESNLIKTVESDIQQHYQLSLKLATLTQIPASYTENSTSCIPIPSLRPFVESKRGHLDRMKAAVLRMTDWQIRGVFLLTELINDGYTFVCILCSILLSMRLTIWIMSRLVRSRLWAWLSFLMSLIIAAAVPFVVIETTTYLISVTYISLIGTIPDFYYLDNPTVLNLAWANSNLLSILSLSPESIGLAIWFKYHLGAAANTIASIVLGILALVMSAFRLKTFLDYAGRFNSFDFNIPEIEVIRNWGVFTDVGFSISYLSAAYVLVLSNRYRAVREYFLDTLQEIDSEPKGPLFAMWQKTKLLCGAALAYVKSK